MKKFLTVSLALFAGAILVGCATTLNEQQIEERFEKTRVGMTLDEFRVVWPDATLTWGRSIETGEPMLVAIFQMPRWRDVLTYNFAFEEQRLIGWW